MNELTRRVAVMQDLSCLGRCSLGVAMAVLPAMGVEAAVLPTAILSTHTAFEGFTFLDFTSEAERIMQHWADMKLHFDAIYIGYLGSIPLIKLAERFMDTFAAPDVQLIVDPAFGDNGKLYKCFDLDYVAAMRELCKRAHIILPNVTEASFLLDMPYGDDAVHCAQLAREAQRLLTGSLQNVLITSCRFSNGEIGLTCVGKDAFAYPHEELELSCHGTGDLFASVFVGLMQTQANVKRAACAAADFARDCIRHSMSCPDHRWYGADFERMLPKLMEQIDA